MASGTLTPSPSSASFGTVPLGTSNTQTIQLKNTGSGPITISSASLSGTNFSMSGLSIPKSLAPAATVNLTVKFAPTSVGSDSGKITLTNNGSTETISLSGTGESATRTLSVSSSSLSFGSESIGGTTTLEVTVTNKGNSSVAVSQMSVNGSAFSAIGGLGGVSLSAGQAAYLLVDFSPKVAGSQTGQVVITSNASNSPTSIGLSGTGVGGTSTSHSVALTWTASTSSGVTGYYVYRATSSGGTFTRINSLPTSATKYTDGSVIAGDTYYYAVTAVNSSGAESSHSSAVTAEVP